MSDVTVFEGLIGKTCTSVKQVGYGVVFILEDGDEWYLYHAYDCCEDVFLEEVIGNLSDLEGSPILMAEVVTEDIGALYWSFYKFRTHKGDVTIRWCADTDSYYSIEVSFRTKTSLGGTTPSECVNWRKS